MCTVGLTLLHEYIHRVGSPDQQRPHVWTAGNQSRRKKTQNSNTILVLISSNDEVNTLYADKKNIKIRFQAAALFCYHGARCNKATSSPKIETRKAFRRVSKRNVRVVKV